MNPTALGLALPFTVLLPFRESTSSGAFRRPCSRTQDEQQRQSQWLSDEYGQRVPTALKKTPWLRCFARAVVATKEKERQDQDHGALQDD